MKIIKITGLIHLLAVFIAFPLVFSDPAVTTIAVFTVLFAVATTGWNIFSGYTGYIALGHAAYFGLVAYAMALMAQDWKIPAGYAPFFLLPLAGLLAIRDDEDRALGLGVKTGPSKLVAFVISAFLVGMVGALHVYFIGSLFPPFAFDATFDVAVALMAFLGGIGTLAGPILGALILEPTQQYFTLQYGENGYYLVI